MMNVNNPLSFGLRIIFVCLYITPSHNHHCVNFIWRHRTYKMPVRYNLTSVWVRLSIFSQLSIIQYVGLCVFSLPIPFVMIENIYIICLIVIIKSEVWTITHCLGLGHETMVCAVCLSIFLRKKTLLHIAVGMQPPTQRAVMARVSQCHDLIIYSPDEPYSCHGRVIMPCESHSIHRRCTTHSVSHKIFTQRPWARLPHWYWGN